MKTKFKWLVIVFALMLSVSTLFVACHKHEYGEWTVKTAPTETSAGTAERKCTDGDDSEEVELKPLSDASFWTVSETAATHTADGLKKYTSAYVTINVTIPKGAHTFGDWTIAAAPTLEVGGTAKRVCTASDGGEETVALPALTDTSVWEVKSTTPATHTSDGSSVYKSAYGEVTIALPKTAHTFGEWTITKKPTLEEEGSAKRVCTASDGGEESAVLPVLSDTDVWTVESRVNATHIAEGSVVYTSDYGDVTVTLPKLPHTFENAKWEVRTAPTKTTAGVAVRYCTASDGGEETVELPVLTDTDFWTVTNVEASYNEAGGVRYTSAYVTIEEKDPSKPKLVAPYDSKTYYPLGFMAGSGDFDKVCSVQTSWNRATLELDANGSDPDSSAYPFMGGSKVTMVDPATGEVSVTVAKDTYKGFVDMSGKTDFIVMFYGNYVFLLTTEYKTEIINVGADEEEGIEGTPTEIRVAYSTATSPIASAWRVGANTAFAITYECENAKGTNIFVYNDDVVFGVSFADMRGNAVAADMCFDASCVYVVKGETNLYAFGHDGEKMHVLDGNEGIYTPEDTTNVQGTLTVSGFGKITLDGNEGTYTVSEDVLEAFIGGVYYIVELKEGNKHSTVAPKITLKFSVGEHGAVTPSEKEFGVKVAAELPVPTTSDDSVIFAGWAFDEEGTELVPNGFKPERSHDGATLYAVWKEKVVFTVTVDGETTTVNAAVGDVVGDLLPVIEKIDEEGRRQFMGWEAKAQGSEDYRDLNTASRLTAQYKDMNVRAKWEDLPAYYGEYTGSAIRSSVYQNGYTLKIDENGKITGEYDSSFDSKASINGKVSSYNRQTQIITWQSDEDNSIHYFMFDENSGVLLVDYELKSTISTIFTAFVMGGEEGDVSAFRILAANYNSAHSRLLVISDGTMLVLDDKIHSGVMLENAFGETITFADFDNFMKEKRTEAGTYTFTLIVKPNGGGEAILARGVKIVKTWVTSSGSGSLGGDEGDYEDGDDEPTTTLKTEEIWYDLDAVYGVYTAGGETVKLDGMGDIVYGNKSGAYAAVSGESYYDVYLENKSEYYRMTLDASAKTATVEMPKANVTLDLDEIAVDGFDTSLSVNINIPYELPVPANTAENFFGGWFKDAACENAVAVNDEGQYIVTVTADTTYYAKWYGKVTLTVVYNNGEDNGSFELPWNTVKTLDRPAKAGYRFEAWYTTSTFDEGTEWISGETPVTADMTVYAKWGAPHAFYGTYRYANLDPSETGGIVKETDTYNATSNILTIDEYGKASGQANGTINGTIEEYNEQTGRFVLNNNGSLSKGGADLANGVLYFDYLSGKTEEPYHDIKFFVKNNGEVGATSSFNNAWDKGCTKFVLVKYSDDSTKVLLIYNRIVYGGITWTATKADGSELTDFEKIYSDAQIIVISKDNATLFKFGRLNNNFVALDGYEDIDYTGTLLSENVTLNVDGAAIVSVGEKTGTYSLAPAGSSYTADLYFDGKYFELTLDKTAKTFSVNMPMVTISFTTEFESVAPMTVNKNIGIELPALTHDGQYLYGWYTSSDFAEGTEVVLQDGKFVPEADTMLYAKWIVPHALMGTYKGYEFDTSTLRSSLTTLIVDVFGNLTGQFTGKIESYENGVATLLISSNSNRKYAYYDSASGTLVTNYGTSASTALSTDLYVLIKASDDDTFASSGTPNYIRWNDNKTKLGKFKINGEDKFFFVYENKVYGDVRVSVKASDDSEVTSMSDFASNGNVMTISRNNTQLFKFGHNGTTFVPDDGTAGDYTGSLGSIRSDGYGHLTIGGETVDVTVDGDGKLHFVAANTMRVISLGDGVYTLEQDGYAGTYTLPDGTTKVTLDGNGNAGAGSTYVVSGSNITLYTSGETAKYGIDVANKLFLGKSVFAGQTFTGRGKDVWGDDSPMKIVFDDDSSISGIFYNSGDSFAFKFTAELSGNTLTLTFTEVQCDKASVGKTLTAEVTDNTIKLVSTTITSKYQNCVGSVLTLVA